MIGLAWPNHALGDGIPMMEAIVYSVSVALFGFVVAGAARMRHDMLLLACMPPVFLALIVGFIMAVYLWDTHGLPPVLVALVVPWPLAWRLGNRYSPRDLLISIYLAWALAMVCALIGFSFPDAP
jgi:hypothetical protein